MLPAMWCLLCALDTQMCVAARPCGVYYVPSLLKCLLMAGRLCWHVPPLTCLLCFLLPYPTHASGFLLFLQLVSDRLAACHVVLVVCPRCADVCSCPAMWCIICALNARMCVPARPCGVCYVPLLPRCVCCQTVPACAPLTCLLCFLLPYSTHASGSPLILQLVSDRLAACHVVLFLRPRCADVCACPAIWCILCALVAQMCADGRLCWHVPL